MAGRHDDPRALELLYEPDGLEAFELPAGLGGRYGGTLGFEHPRLFVNFISTVDGVVAMPSEPGWSSQLIGGATGADRFVMALLRACAGALLIGASTFGASSAGRWTAEAFCPEHVAAFATLRSRLGLAAQPELVVLTRRGELDPGHPALEAGALVLTTPAGHARLRSRLPGASEAIAVGDGPTVDARAAVELLRARGHELILSEGGPSLFGALLAAGVADELFLTVSPLLAGRAEPGARLGLVEGAELAPGSPVNSTLLGVRRDRDYLFLRYALRRPG
ncbi:MAG: dihydrofolate reductase family protein [Gaiellales bacterium]